MDSAAVQKSLSDINSTFTKRYATKLLTLFYKYSHLRKIQIAMIQFLPQLTQFQKRFIEDSYSMQIKQMTLPQNPFCNHKSILKQ